jgi:hypothetical protein
MNLELLNFLLEIHLMSNALRLVEPKKITISMEMKSILTILLFVKLLSMLMPLKTLLGNHLKFK